MVVGCFPLTVRHAALFSFVAAVRSFPFRAPALPPRRHRRAPSSRWRKLQIPLVSVLRRERAVEKHFIIVIKPPRLLSGFWQRSVGRFSDCIVKMFALLSLERSLQTGPGLAAWSSSVSNAAR